MDASPAVLVKRYNITQHKELAMQLAMRQGDLLRCGVHVYLYSACTEVCVCSVFVCLYMCFVCVPDVQSSAAQAGFNPCCTRVHVVAPARVHLRYTSLNRPLS